MEGKWSRAEQGRCPVPCGNNITILTEPLSPAMGTQASVVLQNIQGKTHLNEPTNYSFIPSHSLYVWDTQVTDIHFLASIPLQLLILNVNICSYPFLRIGLKFFFVNIYYPGAGYFCQLLE